MPSPFREIAKLAALTLMRLTEVRTLRREMVHLEQGVVLLPEAKAGARPVVLSAAARKTYRVNSSSTPARGCSPVQPAGRTAGSASGRCSGWTTKGPV